MVDEQARATRLSGWLTALVAAAVAFVALFRVLLELGADFFALPPVRAVCDALSHLDPGPAWWAIGDQLGDVPVPIAAAVGVLAAMVFTAFVQPLQVHLDERRRELVARTSRWPFRPRVLRLPIDAVLIVRVERVLPFLGRWIVIDDEGRRVALGPARFGSPHAATAMDAHLQRLRGDP